VVNAAVIVVWLWSRIAGLPVGPEPEVAEQVGVADSISTAFEAVIVVWGALLLTSAAHIRKGSRRFVPALALLIWGTVIALSVWAVLAGTDGVPSRH
jgi:hypothetical protein